MIDYWLVALGVAAFGACLAVSLAVGRRPGTTDLENELARLRIRVDMLAAASHPRSARVESATHVVLKAVADSPRTARQIQAELGQSREHVARMVKRMSEEGYLERGGGRPFVYTITPAGRRALEAGATGA